MCNDGFSGDGHNGTCEGTSTLTLNTLINAPYILYVYMYRLTHGFRRYTGNIPEALMNTAQGRSPRVVFISTEGIPRIPYKASGLTNL